MKKEGQLFSLLNKKVGEKWEKFSRYYVNDSKSFINKIKRDYGKKGHFPTHILKQIKNIPKEDYDSAVCVLRGALPYAILFEAQGWKIHYLICGRKNENVLKKKRYNQSIDRTLKQIKGKKILIIENNSPSGDTPILVSKRLRNSLKIQKPDLFLDYFIQNKKNFPDWLIKKGPFWKTKNKLNNFGKIYEASSIKVSEKEKEQLIEEFLDKLK